MLQKLQIIYLTSLENTAWTSCMHWRMRHAWYSCITQSFLNSSDRTLTLKLYTLTLQPQQPLCPLPGSVTHNKLCSTHAYVGNALFLVNALFYYHYNNFDIKSRHSFTQLKSIALAHLFIHENPNFLGINEFNESFRIDRSWNSIYFFNCTCQRNFHWC